MIAVRSFSGNIDINLQADINIFLEWLHKRGGYMKDVKICSTMDDYWALVIYETPE